MENKIIPENANTHCPGTNNPNSGKEDACKGCPNKKICSSKKEEDPEKDQIKTLLNQKLSKIKHKILVLSGKGGVGKSTLSSQLAFSLSKRGYEVGLLDLDLCGPSIPRTMGLEGQEVHKSSNGWSPVYVEDNLGVMSIGFMLPEKDAPVIWRGPKKNGLIQQFVLDVDWDELDFLIVDTPPGTSDEHISIVQYLQMDSVRDGAVLVSTGQKLSVNDVRKEVNFCLKTDVNILGVVENMKNLICRECGTDNVLFGGGKTDYVGEMIKDFGIGKCGDLSFSKELLMCTENGKSLYDEELKDIKGLEKIRKEIDSITDYVCKKVGFEEK